MKYLIKNLSGKELEMDWTIDLLPEDMYLEWMEYTNTDGYKNAIKVEQRRIIDILNDFVTEKRLGVLGTGYSNDIKTGNQIKFPKFKFIFKKDEIILVSERVKNRFLPLERFAIVQTRNGQDTEDVVYEGFLDIQEVEDDYKLEETNINNDPDVDVLAGKKYFELRKMAKTRGLVAPPGIKMPELLEILRKDLANRNEKH